MIFDRLYVSTTASDAAVVAKSYGLGIEIAEFCTAWNMDDEFIDTDKCLELKLKGITKRFLHAPFNELFPCAIDKKARELASYRYKQAIDLAKHYNATKVIIHGGYNPHLYYHSWYVEQSILFWKSFMSELSCNIQIVLENTSEEIPELLLNIVKDVNDSRLRLCLDVGHVNTYSKISPFEWLEACKDYITHFHLHNNDGSHDFHNSLDSGSIPMKEFISLSHKLCPEATYTIEMMNAKTSVKWLMDLFENKTPTAVGVFFV